MKHIRLALLLAPAALALCTPTFGQTPAWPHEASDVAPDPAVRFGKLPNGLRYAILHNETPSTAVSLRLLIGTGSSVERDDEQGLMHFLEHMSFRSSDKIADGDVVRILQRHGLRFGADTNAFTFFDRIVYQFDFANNDPDSVNDGMMILREIASKLKLEAALVEAEKGVVLSEERARDTAGLRGLKAQQGLAAEGTRHVSRFPVGTVESLKTATPAKLRRLYEANFRPDNAVLVVVGNVDAAVIEKDIQTRFADWKPVGPADSFDPGKPAPSRTAAEYTGEGAPDYVQIDWPGAPDLRPDSKALEREKLLRLVGLTVLNNRLSDGAGKPGAPYVAAGANAEDKFAGDMSSTSLQVASAPEKWREALNAALTEQRQLMEGGISDADLARAVRTIKTQLQVISAGSATRTTPALADRLIEVAKQNEVFDSPAQSLAFAGPVLDAATPQSVMEALQTAFAGRKPVLFRSAKAGPVGEAALSEALATSLGKPLAKREADAAFTWPYGDWGKPGVVVSRSEDPALGTTTVRFANGTRLIVKPTSFAKDSVRVMVSLGGGRATIPPGLTHALWAGDQIVSGGTGKASLLQIQQWAGANGKAISVSPMQTGLTSALSGTTRPADLDTELELLAAFARDPGFRPEMEDKVKATAPMYANQIGGNAMLAFIRAKSEVLAGHDGRFTDLPSDADLAATKAGDVKALWAAQLANPADVTIVGDVTVDKAVAAVAGTFGAGPAIKRQPFAKGRVTMPPPREAPYVYAHGGRKDQAFYALYWQMPDYFVSPREAAAADVLSKVVAQRLIDSVREKLGITYAPSTEAVAAKQITGLSYMGATIETPEANFATFRKIVLDQMIDLAARPVSADELLRAQKQIVESRKQEREKNEYWLPNLANTLRLPAMRMAILQSVSSIESVTAADLQVLAKKRVAGKLPVTIVVKARD